MRDSTLRPFLQAGAGRATAVGLPSGPWPTARRARSGRTARSGGAWSPPTVVRDDLPFDEGSLQLFMPAHFEEHYFTLVEQDRLRPELGAHLRARHRDQQHRPQVGPLPAGNRRHRLGHRQRTVVPLPVQAAHRDLGLRGRTTARRREPGPALTAGRRPSRAPRRGAHRPGAGRHPGPNRGSARCGPVPVRRPRPPLAPGRWCRPSVRAGEFRAGGLQGVSGLPRPP